MHQHSQRTESKILHHEEMCSYVSLLAQTWRLIVFLKGGADSRTSQIPFSVDNFFLFEFRGILFLFSFFFHICNCNYESPISFAH